MRIIRLNHDIVGLGVDILHHAKLAGIIRCIAQFYINDAGVQIGVDLPRSDLVGRIAFDRAFDSVEKQKRLQSAHVFRGTLHNTDGLAAEIPCVIAADGVVILPGQQHGFCGSAAVIWVCKILFQGFRIIGAAHQVVFTRQKILGHIVAVGINVFIGPVGILSDLIEIIHHQAVAVALFIDHGKPRHLRERHADDFSRLGCGDRSSAKHKQQKGYAGRAKPLSRFSPF